MYGRNMMASDDESSQQGKKPATPSDKKGNDEKKDSSTAQNDGEPEEGFMDKMKRSMSNCAQSCGLCCFKFKEQSQISAIQLKVTNRQKQFGVDYLTLVQDRASQQALKKCLKDALGDIGKLQRDMNVHFDAIDEKEVETKEKIKEAPAPSGSKSAKKKKPAKKEENDEETKKDGGEKKPKKKRGGKAGPQDSADPKFTIDEE